MESFYQTVRCQADHLNVPESHWIDFNMPFYELRLYDDETYDSFQAGYKYSDRKPISQAGVDELKRLVDSGWFTNNRLEAMSAKDARDREPWYNIDHRRNS
jgi:hypothetical protein